MKTARLLLLGLLLLGSAGRAAAQDVGPVISTLKVNGRFATRGERVTIVGSGFETGRANEDRAPYGEGRTVTVDGHPAQVVFADRREVAFVVPNEVLPGPVRVRLAIDERGVSESTLMVRASAGGDELQGLGGCVDIYYMTWTSDPGMPEDPPDPVLAQAVDAAFEITRFERVPGANLFVAEGTCGGIPDGWPVVLELRRDRVVQARVAVELRDGRWRAHVGRYTTPGSYTLFAEFQLGVLPFPEARDFRLGDTAARQGLYDNLFRDATLELR